MQNLPTAEVYEKEFTFMPWGKVMRRVQELVVERVPQHGKVLDLLCGPGYLLGQLQGQRNDIAYTGVDLEPEYIAYAQERYPHVAFIVADAAQWESDEQFDAVVCTGGLHHLSFGEQAPFLQKIARLVKPGGFAVVADPYIDDFTNEEERKLAGARLGYEYLCATIRNGATDDVIASAVGILQNDVLLIEYKTSINTLRPVFEAAFSSVTIEKLWPEHTSAYGDHLFLLER